jgi:phosphoenolpyruvate---glycerone phosphotransferase subunit DhaL
MGKATLTLEETRQMLLYVSQGMVENTQLLTQADQAIGDGDHGIGMQRGFEEVQRRLESGSFSSIGDLFKTTGTALMSSIGGASGAIFGTFFRGGATGLGDGTVLTSEQVVRLLSDGLRAVEDRGQAKPGDKTMVDALEPAARKAPQATSPPLDEALAKAAEAARQGMESTKGMVATVGKAKTLGERSLGHVDPGALSMYLILSLMAEYVGHADSVQ